jgi:hypothetical protein
MPELQYEVVWPLSKQNTAGIAGTAALGNLNGKRIAFVWDNIFKGDEMFSILREHLSHEYPLIEFVGHEEFGNIHGVEENQVIAELSRKMLAARVDAAIVGVGA